MNTRIDLPSTQIQGKWAISRSQNDQTMVLKMAEEYFKQNDLEFLSRIVNKPALTFDANEAQVLLARSDAKILMGLTKQDNPGTGYLQFYDFCLTIDTLKNIMRGMYVHLTSKVINKEMLDNFKRVVQFPDMVPVEIRNTLALKLAGGSVLGARRDKFKPEFNSLTGDAYIDRAGVVQTKTFEQRAFDEAYCLKSPIFNNLQALAQGLFAIFVCPANKLTYPKGDREVDMEKLFTVDKLIPETQWINTFEDKLLSFRMVSGTGIDVDNDSNITQILQPKRHGIEFYKSKEEVHNIYATLDSLPELPTLFATAEMPHAMPETGGAIAKYILWHDATTGTYFIPNEKQTITPEMLKHRFERLPFHPIHACGDLARAYQRSGMFKDVFDVFSHLQRALEGAAFGLEQQGQTTDKMFSIDSMHQTAGAGIVPSCGAGLVPRFKRDIVDEKTGRVTEIDVAEEEAFVVRDGNVELASHIKRSNWECVPRVSIAEMARKSSSNNMDFRPVVVNKAPLVTMINQSEEPISGSDLRRQVEKAGGFVGSQSAVGGVTAEMAAYAVPAELLDQLD